MRGSAEQADPGAIWAMARQLRRVTIWKRSFRGAVSRTFAVDLDAAYVTSLNGLTTYEPPWRESSCPVRLTRGDMTETNDGAESRRRPLAGIADEE